MSDPKIPHCPKCGSALLEFTYQQVRLDQCLHCEGIWLDAGELDKVVRGRKGLLLSLEYERKRAHALEREHQPPPEEAAHLRALHLDRCPRCGGTLEEAAFHQIRLDRCPDCAGVWLDAGELEAVAGSEHGLFHALQRHLLGAAAAPGSKS